MKFTQIVFMAFRSGPGPGLPEPRAPQRLHGRVVPATVGAKCSGGGDRDLVWGITGKSVGLKAWENQGKNIYRKIGKKHGKNVGKNLGKKHGKPGKITRKTWEKNMENLGKS